MRTRAFTVIELPVVISIMTVLITILLPVVSRARRTAKGGRATVRGSHE